MPHLNSHSAKAVYRWEDQHIFPTLGLEINKDDAQNLVNMIWSMEGRDAPPEVIFVDKNRSHARANRFEINIPKNMAFYGILIHELVHSLTTEFDGNGVQHGPIFVKKYIDVLVDYFKFDKKKLVESCKEYKIKVATDEEYKNWKDYIQMAYR